MECLSSSFYDLRATICNNNSSCFKYIQNSIPLVEHMGIHESMSLPSFHTLGDCTASPKGKAGRSITSKTSILVAMKHHCWNIFE